MTNQTEREALETLCPHCDGLGGFPAGGPICCGNAEWECGASGCTGPIDGSYLERCQGCNGTGRAAKDATDD